MFIVLEGIDGCGKTTQIKRVRDYLASRIGEDRITVTREPGGWDGGEAMRELALGGGLSDIWSEFFYFMMDRCEHVARVIAPALSRGGAVLCDRYFPSTLAYQVLSSPDIRDETAGYMMGLADAIGLPRPDRVFFLDISPDEARTRLGTREKRDGFDARGVDFFKRVRDGYLRLMDAGGVWVRIDASAGPDEVFAALEREMAGLHGEPGGGPE
jgi:dTMP kinase